MDCNEIEVETVKSFVKFRCVCMIDRQIRIRGFINSAKAIGRRDKFYFGKIVSSCA